MKHNHIRSYLDSLENLFWHCRQPEHQHRRRKVWNSVCGLTAANHADVQGCCTEFLRAGPRLVLQFVKHIDQRVDSRVSQVRVAYKLSAECEVSGVF